LPPITATVGETLEFGGYEWRVLEVDGGKALLLSEYVEYALFRQYHNESTDITWADCDLRAYLNDEFYNSFGESERARIVLTRVSTKDNEWFGNSGGDDTDDYIFLLSLEEVIRYFGDSGQLANQPEGAFGINDEYNEARIAYDLDGSHMFWRLRSPGLGNNYAAEIGRGGDLNVMGMGVTSDSGLRPAMWVNLD
jgi:hypothetical protein